MRNFLTLLLLCATITPASAASAPIDDDLHTETRVKQARDQFGVSGDGVIVTIIDRGIEYEHPDFRNEDGTTRILYIFDLTDDSGSSDADNPYGIGTVYTEDEINAALTAGPRLATRDAVGHGTASAGIAGGNGRGSSGLYDGVATNASFIIVKFTTEGAPAHDGEPAEAPFYMPDRFETALDFAVDKAAEHSMPMVALANFGSVGGIPDGTTAFARAVNDRFGPGKPGLVFVTGSSDDGGGDNHARTTITQGQTVDLQIRKNVPGNLRLQLWYEDVDRFDAEIVTPNNTFGPYAAPSAEGVRDTQFTSDFNYYHNGSQVDFSDAASSKREILIDLIGPTGDYVLRLTGATVTNGLFHAWLNPASFSSTNGFDTFVVPGYTVWEMAAAESNIAPNDYVLRTDYTDVDGVARSRSGEGDIGDLWIGSGIGPTVDGRTGVTVSAPGEFLIAPYGARTYYSTFRFNTVFDGGSGALYGLQTAVSAASPVVTGIIALMLEANPQLDASQVKDILQSSARSDSFTGAVPNNIWGYGKVDAFAAVDEVLKGTGIEHLPLQPTNGVVAANFPNPFRLQTTIRYELPVGGKTRIVVYDMLGREVSVLVDKLLPQGSHEVDFRGANFSSGTYFYRVELGQQTATGIMTLAE